MARPCAGDAESCHEGRRLRIVVIGSGFGGLAAGIRLRAQGHEVTIVEKLGQPGGRAAVFVQDGFTFDAGPTIVTAPWLIDQLFALAGRSASDYVTLVPLSPFYQVRFEDGTVFPCTGRDHETETQIRRLNPADVDGFRRFSAAADEVFDAAMPLIDQPFHTLPRMLRQVPALARVRAWRSVARMVSRYVSDERVRQVLSFHPLLIGGNPFEASSIYALIHSLEKRWGVWYAMGGTGALVQALATLFKETGGLLRLKAEAREILIDDRTGRATGVRLVSGEVLQADAVVSNADFAHTYLTLVPARARKVNTDARVRRRRQAMSLVVIYFGTDRRYPDLAHHEILMGPRYRGLLEDIFRRRHLAEDFSLYLHRPTATDPSLAPDGCDAWYVLSPVPNLGGNVDWEVTIDRYRDAIVRYLEARYLPNLSQHIVTERRVDPRYFRDSLNSHLGSAFSVEPTLTQSAWFRPHNVSEDVPNLFLVGAGTHPGAGIPGVLSSGKIVADLIGRAG
ncbi:MAG: Phytoene desaturase (lycopene-forming) [Gemmatimonadaceae bacterium]|nr:Phytoene desaturase (lycopene-forming) [Gemmatimonadaceae bacterium]